MAIRQIDISVRELVEFVMRSGNIDSRFTGFDRALEGARIHRKLQKELAKSSDYTPEVTLQTTKEVDGIVYNISGRADGVLKEDNLIIIDEIKTTAVKTELLTCNFSKTHWAQAKCYAAIYQADNKLQKIAVQITYYQIDTNEIIRHRKAFNGDELSQFLNEVLTMYTPWAQMENSWRSVRNNSITSLKFPFPSYRDGQYRLAGAVYKTIESRGRLFACAPTGIGKTISTLFPSVKALGNENGQRIFYLTAKTITRQTAQDALQLLRSSSNNTLRLKSVTLTAKDKICFLESRECTPEACPYANGYYDRINTALYTLLQTNDCFTKDEITAFAKQQTLCPFELSLDLTNFCDCIICDYNYLFDPVVSLKRFFENGGDFIFLVDEAHNLVSRSREMYSAHLCKSNFYLAKKAVGKKYKKLANSLAKVNNAFIDLRHKAAESETFNLVSSERPTDFSKAIYNFIKHATEWLDENRSGQLHEEILQLYFDAKFFMRIFELYDEHFVTLTSLKASEVRLDLLCLDASEFLNSSMSLGRSSVLFSATLTPSDYFIKTLGGGDDAKRTMLENPFAQDNLCLVCNCTISTKYNDRTATLQQILELINATTQAKKGNYMVFFPSYKYMIDAAEGFKSLYPNVSTLFQESGMDEAQRDEFLEKFSSKNSETLVGFCVLGGVFSEGIDLSGNSLIGTIIVGVGLPQINTVQNALKDYYTQSMDSGFAYAYQYPGMNKVLQAAGRVIRTQTDKGVVLLIDDRYSRLDYKALFPPHWSHLKYVNTAEYLCETLNSFWQNT